jgi:hypothetical protein
MEHPTGEQDCQIRKMLTLNSCRKLTSEASTCFITILDQWIICSSGNGVNQQYRLIFTDGASSDVKMDIR